MKELRMAKEQIEIITGNMTYNRKADDSGNIKLYANLGSY